MFKKILVANRGEIACRVFKTAKRMGIATVAVYSEADRNALHVEMADEAVFIGPPAAAESYLVIDKIVEACKQTGAEAVHPGYGFLSERAEFAERLAAEGIAFIGPPKGAIEAMGDKITSKKIAAEAGVSTVPGVMGLIDDADHAVRIATEIGYPVMIKASAGGGGKGMRIAWNDEEAREGYDRSKSEAASSFGDDRIFIEKFVTEPRHIEIQVLADTKGNCIYLGERECSIQRRNQKVIEEAPSPFLDRETRKAMGEQAVALARAVDYASAGTVEFIVDKDRNFYFLEMNTRLQVEHPVTELITGVDLVEQMIRVAAGETLGIGQDDIKLNGWAVESRLYAEDPYRNFLPSIGRLTRYRPPAEGAGADGHIVRNDTGVFEGGEISMFYDPMIAKLCTWAPDRNMAVERMADALDHFEVEGIGHNIPFLSAVMDHDRFRSGNITTAFIAEEYPEGFHGVEADCQTAADLCAVAAVLDAIEAERRARTASDRFAEDGASETTEKTARMERENTPVRIRREGDEYAVTVGEKSPMRLKTDWQPGETLCQVGIDGAAAAFKVDPVPGGYRLRHRGVDRTVQVLSGRVAELAALMPEKLPPDTSKMLLCPMPGLVVALHVEEGAEVEEGQSLAIVEAMKMENVLRAERPGKVAKIPVSVGDSLAVDAVIMEFEA
ncbi:acetyl/propionyl/methylcrotonyl-CoA carboxylase subunit alpha [Nitratireductor sp. XY-223]|uniref:acetyl-CoA carboxylase biotin carboxylase subunit n=1 Tax=Nitratireductor sp. XY-223 TaxID=2561926 RepID=UPI0010AA0848|nr:acetyl/propionyl/methylcrotonyl-CoA carboxylase subunit alpha [Nitratireductor sp. XY-223]